jgi:hypothetical protein
MADYALIVGIEHYMTTSISPVRYAEADAQGLAATLTELRFEVDCLLLSHQATKNILEGLRADLLGRAIRGKTKGNFALISIAAGRPLGSRRKSLPGFWHLFPESPAESGR